MPYENGNILIGGGYNSVFVELDKNDSIVWKLSAADIPEFRFNFAAAGQPPGRLHLDCDW